MAILDLLAAIALLLWGSRQLQRGLRELCAPWVAAVLPHAQRGRYAAFGAGLAAGLPHPADGQRTPWLAQLAAPAGLPLATAYAVLLGAHLGGAAAMLLFVRAPGWAFQALAIAGAAATLAGRHARVRVAGRAMFGAALVLLALQILALAAQSGAATPLGEAVTEGLRQDALLAVTAGALLALCLRSVFPAVLLVAATGVAWLTPQSALAVLLGIQVGGAIVGWTGSGGEPFGHRLGAGHLLATALAALACVLLLADLAQLVTGLAGEDIVVLHAGFHALVAAAFLNLAGPLARGMERWVPGARDEAGAPGMPRLLQPRDLQVPSLALAGAVRETMRVADLVDRMLRMVKDVFVAGDPVAVQAVRDAEERVDRLYQSLTEYLAQVPRRPMNTDELLRWEELMAFLVAAEQVADRIERMLLDLETKKIAAQLAYPAQAEAEILALHDQVAQNLRLAAGVFLERGVAAASDLAAAKATFREMERSFRAAHVARLVAGDRASVEISALHLDLVADLADMNDQVCAFARFFLELRAAGTHRTRRVHAAASARAGTGLGEALP